MKKLLISLFLILPLYLTANPLQIAWKGKDEHKWNTVDTVTQSTFILFMLIDWKQTDYMMSQTRTVYTSGNVTDQNGNIIGTWSDSYETYAYEEQNWILGKHPSRKKVAIYNLSMIAGHTLVAYVLPNPYRKLWQTFGIGIEIYATSTNFVEGAKINFSFKLD